MSVELEPLDVAHVKRLRELHQQPGVERWWGPMEPGFPFDEAESTRFAIVVDDEIAGMVQYGEEEWEDFRHAYIDVFVGDDYAGRGIGTDVVKRMIEMLVRERGHHRITIDPDPENEGRGAGLREGGLRARRQTQARLPRLALRRVDRRAADGARRGASSRSTF